MTVEAARAMAPVVEPQHASIAPPLRRAAFGPHDLEALLTVEDVAALLRVSKSWVYEHTRARGTPRSGQLRHVKIGKYVRFEPEAVREFLAARARHI